MGKPDVLQSMVSQRVRHDLATERQQGWLSLESQSYGRLGGPKGPPASFPTLKGPKESDMTQ